MALYRKKPVVIEAIQFDPLDVHRCQLPDGVIVTRRLGGEDNYAYHGIEFGIETLEGTMRVVKGDWVIKGVNGEYYPCKPDIFEKTYEIVEQGETARPDSP